jgi:general secretion pathway protein K
MKRQERGFALVAVMLVLGLLGIIAAEFGYSMRLEAEAMRAWRDQMRAAHLAEAGIAQALRELAGEFSYVSLPFDGVLTFYTQGPPVTVLPRFARTKVRLGPGEFTYRITDEQSRINVNAANQDRLDKLLQCMGVEKVDRDQIVDSILDWIDPNDEHRTNGAESDDYYLKLPAPYRAHNSTMESINELLQVKGVTPALFDGVDGRPGLKDVLTVRGATQPNINTAGPVVLCAMGVLDTAPIMQGRLEAPISQITRPDWQGFGFNSNTFRIEAEGIVDGRSRASVTAIVQRGNNVVVVQEWSGSR